MGLTLDDIVIGSSLSVDIPDKASSLLIIGKGTRLLLFLVSEMNVAYHLHCMS